MTKPRLFTTMPVRAIADTRLTALELRCLMVISLHDGMSDLKGSGSGCYARISTLAALARTDISNFSKAVSRLAKLGYIAREAQQNDRRRFTLRVLFPDGDDWRTDQLSGGDDGSEKVGEPTNHCSKELGAPTSFRPELVGEGEHENGGSLPETASHYIPLNGEIHSEESGKLNSAETARFASRGDGDDRLSGSDRNPLLDAKAEWLGSGPKTPAEPSPAIAGLSRQELQAQVRDAIAAIGSGKELSRITGVSEPYISRARYARSIPTSATEQLVCMMGEYFYQPPAESALEAPQATTGEKDKIVEFPLKENRVEALLGRKEHASLLALLPKGWDDLQTEAQLSHFERALAKVDRDFCAIPPAELAQHEAWLFSIADAYAGEAVGHRAQRLFEELGDCLLSEPQASRPMERR